MILFAVMNPVMALTAEQGDDIIHELEEVAHGIEHIEEYMQVVAYSSIGICLVLLGLLIVGILNYRKK